METISDLTGHKTSNHVVPISSEAEEWINSVEDKISKTPKLLSKSAGKRSCCIFRVPESFVQINEKAYQPHTVSIGPYHHGKQQLQAIEEHKWRFLGAVLARTKAHGVGLNELFAAIAPKEEEIRECYSENIEYSSPQLIEMMILDGCFIIELLCIVGRLVQTHLDDPIFNMAWIFYFLMRDLLRLENQIPFFVLESLFEIIHVTLKENTQSLTELALEYFNYAVQRPPTILGKFKERKGNHLLDLLRATFISQENADYILDENSFPELIQSAKKLRLSGIKFKPKKADSFLDISFCHGLLRIPLLKVDDFTTYFLLNCVAYEQCYKHCSMYITSYVRFMGCLINTATDAGYLSDHRIIENYLGTDDDVAKFFHEIGKDIAFDISRSYLSKVFEDVNRYYRNTFNVKWAGFKHTYFESPWSFMSAMAALVILILTFIQAFFAVYAYVNPPHDKGN